MDPYVERKHSGATREDGTSPSGKRSHCNRWYASRVGTNGLETRYPKRIKKVIGYQHTTTLACGRTARRGGVGAEPDPPLDAVVVDGTTVTHIAVRHTKRCGVISASHPVTVDAVAPPRRADGVTAGRTTITTGVKRPQTDARAPDDVSVTLETRVGV